MNLVSLTRGDLAYIDRGHGITVLLLHGFPLDHTMWSAQIAALSEHARVIAPDIRGFGESPLGDADAELGISMQQHADEMAELLVALNITEPVVIVGFSMGGYIAWQFVRKHADKVRALVQCDTRAVADTEEGRADRIKMAENVTEWGSERVAEMMGPKLFSARALETRPELMAAVRRVVKGTPPSAIAAAQRGMAARPDVTSMLPTITVPTLILVGSDDAISTTTEMRTIAEAIPNAKFVEIPAAGHMTTMEKPEEVSAALIEFLRAFI